MKVWIDQDACTGDGLCEEICPEVFGMAEDGLAYVKDVGQVALYREGTKEPVNQGANGLVNVRQGLEEATEEARDLCPGECIYIEN